MDLWFSVSGRFGVYILGIHVCVHIIPLSSIQMVSATIPGMNFHVIQGKAPDLLNHCSGVLLLLLFSPCPFHGSHNCPKHMQLTVLRPISWEGAISLDHCCPHSSKPRAFPSCPPSFLRGFFCFHPLERNRQVKMTLLRFPWALGLSLMFHPPSLTAVIGRILWTVL